MNPEELVSMTFDEVIKAWNDCEMARWEVGERFRALGIKVEECPEDLSSWYEDWLKRIASSQKLERLENLAKVLQIDI